MTIFKKIKNHADKHGKSYFFKENIVFKLFLIEPAYKKRFKNMIRKKVIDWQHTHD